MTFEDLRLLHENMINAQLDNSKNSDFACENSEYYSSAIQNFLDAGKIYYQNENLDMLQLQDLFKKDLDLYWRKKEIKAIQDGEGFTLSNGVHVCPQFMTMDELEEDLNRNKR